MAWAGPPTPPARPAGGGRPVTLDMSWLLGLRMGIDRRYDR